MEEQPIKPQGVDYRLVSVAMERIVALADVLGQFQAVGRTDHPMYHALAKSRAALVCSVFAHLEENGFMDPHAVVEADLLIKRVMEKKE